MQRYTTDVSGVLLALSTLLNWAWAMNITCSGFDVLPRVTYDNVRGQSLTKVIIAFKQDTPEQMINAYRDALLCRGSDVQEPNYGTGTIIGFVSPAYAQAMMKSPHIEAVEYDQAVSALTSSAVKSVGKMSFGSLKTQGSNEDEDEDETGSSSAHSPTATESLEESSSSSKKESSSTSDTSDGHIKYGHTTRAAARSAVALAIAASISHLV